MIHAHADPTIVAAQVINAVRGRPSQFRIHKIVDLGNPFRVAPLGRHSRPFIAEISHQLFLLGVHRDHGQAPPQTPFHFPVQMLKLSIAIGMIRPFLRFAIALQAIAQRVKQIRDYLMTDLDASSASSSAVNWRTLCTRSSTRKGLSGSPRVVDSSKLSRSDLQRRILIHRLLASTTRPANPVRKPTIRDPSIPRSLVGSPDAADTRRSAHRAEIPPRPIASTLGGRHQTPRPFVQNRLQSAL